MKACFTIWLLVLVMAQTAYGKCDGGRNCCGSNGYRCGEGEGDCDKDDDCLPGYKCKQDSVFSWKLGFGTDICTQVDPCAVNTCKNGGTCSFDESLKSSCECTIEWEGTQCETPVRQWKCDKFPEWLRKTYYIKAIDFCPAQWDDWLFSSRPLCSDTALPTISFYDRTDGQNSDEPLCVINMNKDVGEFQELCPGVSNMLSSNEVWIVYIAHGFGSWGTAPLWYPQSGKALAKRYKQNGRKIIVGEVNWMEGSKAIFEYVMPPNILNAILGTATSILGRNSIEDRAHLESVQAMLTCGPAGLGVGDIAGYSTAASNTMVIGHALGTLLGKIYDVPGHKNLKSYCIGHSLGGHVCGFTGKTKQLDGILALDPAGPVFDHNSKDKRLNSGDAKYVQALHIDAGEFGIDLPVADADIYVNGGKNQPHCLGSFTAFTEAACSHLPFSMYFLPYVWEVAANGNKCFAHQKCLDETDAMYKHEACNTVEGVGIEVGSMSNTGNSGIFWLNTKDTDDNACYFTTGSIAANAMDAMGNVFKDLTKIDISKYIG